jgi:F-type H+-transporting ATPase subunit alpha
MTEVLKQRQYHPLPVEEQVAILWAGSAGFIDKVAVDQVNRFESEYLEYLRSSYPALLERVKVEKALGDDLVAELTKVTEAFISTNDFSGTTAVAAD